MTHATPKTFTNTSPAPRPDPLPWELRVPGQRVKFYYAREDGTEIEYHGEIVPLRDDHPLKAQHEATHELVYVMPDAGKYPWLNWTAFPAAWWDYAVEHGTGRGSPLYAE